MDCARPTQFAIRLVIGMTSYRGREIATHMAAPLRAVCLSPSSLAARVRLGSPDLLIPKRPPSPQPRPQLRFAGDVRHDRRRLVAPVDALSRRRARAAEDADVAADRFARRR